MDRIRSAGDDCATRLWRGPGVADLGASDEQGRPTLSAATAPTDNPDTACHGLLDLESPRHVWLSGCGHRLRNRFASRQNPCPILRSPRRRRNIYPEV